MVSSPRHSRHLGETMWLLSDATNFFSIELEHKKTPRTHIHTIRIALYVAFKVTHTGRVNTNPAEKKADKYPRSKLFRYVLGQRIM